MVSPVRSIARHALAALAALGLVMQPAPAAAQSGGISLIRDTEIEETLLNYSRPIFEAAGFDPKHITILLVGSKDLNAFAAPGVMGIHTGLILQSKNPNELQGVIGHEVGHLAAGHSARSGDMQKAGMTPFLLTMGLGILAAAAGSVDGAAALATSAPYFGTLGALGYSREQESRADQAGATILEKAGLSGRGLADFFDNFRYQEVFDAARRFPYFRSHPLSSDRIESLRHRVSGLSHYNEVDSPEALAEHEIMKAKLDGFINPQTAIVKYQETDLSYPARYARAIAYYQMKEPDRALKLIEALLRDQPNNPYLYELKGQILFEYGRAAEAEAPQRKSVELKPEAPLLRINLGQTLVALEDKVKVDEGIVELNKALLSDAENAAAWRILAEAYDKRGEDGMARLAAAEYAYNTGDEQQARVFAMRAREKLDRNSPQWRRATDIVLVSKPSKEDLRDLSREGSIGSAP